MIYARKFILLLSACLLFMGCWICWAADYILEQTPLVYDEEIASVSEITPFASYREPYESGSISTTIQQYFQTIVAKLPADCHYVLFRESQYNYRLVYASDMVYNDGVFRAENALYVLYDSQSNYNSTPTFSSGSEGSFRLTTNNIMVFTDLGFDYPSLESRENMTLTAVLYALAVILMYSLIREFFRR